MRRHLAALALLLAASVAHAEPSTPTPVYSVTNPTIPFYASWSPPIAGAGYVEIVYTPTGSAPVFEFAYSDPPTAVGNLRVYSSPAVGVWEPMINVGAGQVEAARMDLRRSWVANRKTHYLITWWPLPGGGYAVQSGLQGALDYYTTVPSTSVAIASISAMWVGQSVAGTSWASVATVQRFAVGNVRVSATQARNMAAAQGCTAAKYGFALGDSITALYDFYPTRLSELIGSTSHNVVISDWGNSGDTTSMMLARLGDVGGPLTVPQDYAVILGGTNDVLRLGNTAVSAEQVLREIHSWIKARAGTVVVITTPPIHNTTWTAWDTPANLTQQTALNSWIAAQPGVVVEDAYALFNTVGDGSFRGFPTSKQYSYDGVHPTGAYTNNIGNPNGSDTLAAAIYSALGSPSF